MEGTPWLEVGGWRLDWVWAFSERCAFVRMLSSMSFPSSLSLFHMAVAHRFQDEEMICNRGWETPCCLEAETRFLTGA